jgi:hypothetical protein
MPIFYVLATFTSATDEDYKNILDRLMPFGISQEILPKGSGHDFNNFFQHNTSARLA